MELRAVVEDDIETFYQHQTDPEASAMAAFPIRERAVVFESWRRNLARQDNVSRTIVVDGAVAGNIVSWKDDNRRLLGYWIGREFWGRGVATAGLEQFIAEIRERPLFAFVAASNVGSIRVLEKNGFVRTTEEPEVGEDGVAEWLFRLQ
jgi:RimJ/RimL family protein N-acetyltransferase